MRRVEICVSTKSGMPCVRVPRESIWSLVEYLAFRRVQADFSFAGDGFLALFPHLSEPAAQQLLDDWAAYELDLTEAPMDFAAACDTHEIP